MNRREKLQDAYEDALFALLMEDVIEEEGKRLADENERLKQDPAAAVPRELHEKCMKTIHRRFGLKRQKETTKRKGWSFTQAVGKAAVVVVICMMLFTMAYAVSPELRTATLNLLIKVSDVNTILSVEGGEDPQVAYDTSKAAQDVYEQFGYRIPKLTDDFKQTDSLIAYNTTTLNYISSSGSSVKFSFTKTRGGGYSVDTEGAQRVEDITVNGFDGLLISKDNWIRIVWTNPEHGSFVSVTGTAVSEDLLWRIVNAISCPVE